jgi:hypothetical protein
LRDLLGDADVRELLDADAINDVEEQLQGCSRRSGFAPRTVCTICCYESVISRAIHYSAASLIPNLRVNWSVCYAPAGCSTAALWKEDSVPVASTASGATRKCCGWFDRR